MRATRRTFLQATGAGALAGAPVARAANDRIRFAGIGIGIMGWGDVMTARATPGTELAAVADVYQGRLDKAREVFGGGVFTTRDYREVLARKDIDAVIIATPDHWHARIAEDAMRAGKDVYVQKPMVQKWQDGQRLIDTARETGRILQVGSQNPSGVISQKARALFRSGAIGELNMVEAWIDRNSAQGAWQYSIPPDATPANIDWDRFLGSAPRRPFEPIRLFRWRNYQDYGTGVGGDLFVHLFTRLHFVLDAVGPARIFASGGTRFWRDGRDVPDLLVGLYDYEKTAAHPAFNLALRVNFECGGQENSGFRFVGSEGLMSIDRGVTLSKTPSEREPGTSGGFSRAVMEKIAQAYRATYPPRARDAALEPATEERFVAPRNYSDQAEHHAVFWDAVRTRRPVVEDATFGLRAAAPAVLSNTSYFENRICTWDPVNCRARG